MLPETLAARFACLADPTRLRLLQAVAAADGVTVGTLTERLGVSQSTCSHHVARLAEAGFVRTRRAGNATVVTANNPAALPQVADAVLGLPPTRPPEPPRDVAVRTLRPADWPAVRRIYAEGIATGIATFETTVPSRTALDAKWLPDHRWVAEAGGEVVGWTAAAPVSPRECYAGVAETSLYVDARHRGRGVGRALLHRQVTAADDGGLWTLQSAIFTVNRTSIALHHAAGYRTVGVRERIAQRDGRWHDTVLIERRAPRR
ncbi:MAG TPA: metalloregulator ArsR/SmtB family transcription factor [Actinophytocola sp.]|jgi:L-amino acid N-acyltransferase YncA|uniref:helix-turn-helix domain-containing GNAT family N-acetyltransferase n=1 Tax=Actinophytocola sp. TaxID=1872138 RepID=UPI002F936EA2